jgi:tetratricopeptide (TPR) repeat protein
MLLRALGLLVLAILVLPAAASADPTPEELAEARIHFERARGFEEAGDYKRAADEYLSAYALYPDPEFFFNVGRVYRLADDLQRALRFYERYLELDPDGRGAAAARAQVADLREELGDDADRPDRRDDGVDDDVDTRFPQEDPSLTTPGPLDPSDPHASVHRTQPRSSGSQGVQIAGIATAGGGLAALGASVYFGNRARSLSNEISAWAATNPQAWNEAMIIKYGQGQRANTAMLILGGVGVAAMTTGAILYVVGGNAGGVESRGVAIAPSLLPGGAGVTLGGAF